MTTSPCTIAPRLRRGFRLRHALCIWVFCAVALLAAEMPAGVKQLPNGDFAVAGMVVRKNARELAIPGKFNLEAGPLEVIVALPNGRLHEALLVTEVPALQIQAMLYALGAQNGARLPGQHAPQGTLVDILIEWKGDDGKIQRNPVENWLLDRRSAKPATPIGWTFVGSVVKEGRFMADIEGNVALNYSVGSTILDLPDKESLADDTLHTVNSDLPQPKDITIVLKPRFN